MLSCGEKVVTNCGIGLVFGTLLDQLSLGLCFGIAIGLALDNKKNK
jgi:hypothetical protein